jgi:hypothetical protein
MQPAKTFYGARCVRVKPFYAASTARLTLWPMSYTRLRRGFGRQAPSPPPKSKSWREPPNEIHGKIEKHPLLLEQFYASRILK